MDRDAAAAQIRKRCNGVSVELKVNPEVSALGEKEAQHEIYRAVFELTKQVETIKKRLTNLECRENHDRQQGHSRRPDQAGASDRLTGRLPPMRCCED